MSPLKRTGGWGRKKRLQAKTVLCNKSEFRSTTPLERTGSLSRGTPLTAGQGRLKRAELVSKRSTVTPEERRARKQLSARSGGLCEMCNAAPATDAHHRVNRSQGGRWEITNLLHLDHAHHMQVTVNPALAKERGWSVPGTQDPAMAPVWLAVYGWSLLRPDGSTSPYNREAA